MSAVADSRDVAERRAALELHRLGRDDRAWVLARLAPDERTRAARRLAELHALDVRFEFDDDGIGLAPPPPADAPAPRAPTGAAAPSAGVSLLARARVRDASAAAVVRALGGEPGWLVDALLSIERWPWSDDVRAALGVRAPAATPPLDADRVPARPALAAALIELVAARLPTAGPVAAAGVHDPHAGTGAGWSRLWTGVRQWLR